MGGGPTVQRLAPSFTSWGGAVSEPCMATLGLLLFKLDPSLIVPAGITFMLPVVFGRPEAL